MGKKEITVCDACSAEFTTKDILSCHWEQKPSRFQATCPKDGINGGVWDMDVCSECRIALFNAIRSVIDGRRKHEHLRTCGTEYRGCDPECPFDAVHGKPKELPTIPILYPICGEAIQAAYDVTNESHSSFSVAAKRIQHAISSVLIHRLGLIAQMADTGSEPFKRHFDPDGVGILPTGWNVAEYMRMLALDMIGADELKSLESRKEQK